MMFICFTSSLLLSALLHLNFAFVNGLCLPCQTPLSGGKVVPYTPLGRRSVYSPNVISPSAGTVWVVGSEVTVTWDTRDRPKDVTNPTGKLLLGQIVEGDENEHLDFDHPLAAGFDLGDGHVECTVPEVHSGHNYIVVLMGDSGNRSPAFEIAHSSNQSETGLPGGWASTFVFL
ncbi:hypothetical protein BD779DRAFT_702863 [Infundibulicybe gibba]|nr:hypothetical protein BD779DRAFT_702863 [Infundibulicybe gibba]